MYNETVQNADMNGVGFLLGMLWVFALGAAMLVAYIGRRTNERKEQTYGYELEVIKTAHARSQDANHSLANFLTKVQGKGGWDAYFEGYHHNTRTYTKLVTDSSLNQGGVEIVSPPLRGTTRRRRWLSTVAGKLAGLVKIDRSCGVHLHIGLKKPDESWGDEGVYDWDTARLIGTKVAVIYTAMQEAINTVVPRSRHHQSYTKPNRDLIVQAHQSIVVRGEEQSPALWAYQLYEYARETRYFHVNLTSLSTYGTIEFRQHAGSINPVKLDAWAQLMSAIVARAATISHTEMHSLLKAWYIRTKPYNLTDLAHFLGFSPRTGLFQYFSRRADVLAGVPVDKCPSCAKPDCAGCMVVTTTDWDDIHYSEDDEEYYGLSTFGLGVVMTAVAFGPLVAALALVVGCGIGAIHGRGKQYSQGKTAPALWTALEDRGRQAAGTAWLDADCLREDGSVKSIWYAKDAQSASLLAGGLKRYMGKTTHWQMFHTRFATHGVNNAANAHPHFSSCNSVCLVHNGVVSNYQQVWDGIGRKQTGPVDSQALAEALAVGGINEVIKHAVGTMSLIWADVRDPAGTLHFWTNGENPLHFGRLDNPSGDIMVASTEGLWIEAAGKRAIMEPKLVPKTRRVKVTPKQVSKYHKPKPYFRTEEVKDKRGKPVMHTVMAPSHNWAAIIGKHYTISPKGKIDGYMTDNWQDTTRGAMISWQSYAPAGPKATGTQDVCSLPGPTDPVDGYPTVYDQDLHQSVFDIVDSQGGWPSFIGKGGDALHGYDCLMHEGITPEGERYALSGHIQPWIDDIDRAALLRGEFYDDAFIGGLKAQHWDEAWDLTGFA